MAIETDSGCLLIRSFLQHRQRTRSEQFEDTRCLLSHGKFDFVILRNIIEWFFFHFTDLYISLTVLIWMSVFVCGC